MILSKFFCSTYNQNISSSVITLHVPLPHTHTQTDININQNYFYKINKDGRKYYNKISETLKPLHWEISMHNIIN